MTGILAIRHKMMAEYDALFEKIRACEKKSPMHLRLLRIENRLNTRSKRFIASHAQFFKDKRRAFWSMLEESADPNHELPETEAGL
jgi:hypothetical protein